MSIEKSVREGKTTRAEANALALQKSGDRRVLLVDGSPQSGELELSIVKVIQPMSSASFGVKRQRSLSRVGGDNRCSYRSVLSR